MASDEVARLLSLVSHELRAPLGVMRGYLRLLEQRTDLPEPSREAIAAALRASARAADLLGQVSTLAELARGETTFELATLELSDFLNGLAGDVELPSDPVVRLERGASADVQVVADRWRLHTAVASLASAVVKAQPDGAAVRISCRAADADGQPGGVVEMSRVDMPAKEVTARPLDVGRGGLGLELPIAAAIIAVLRGHITELRAGTACVGMVVWLPSSP